jgi:hypothetical protein
MICRNDVEDGTLELFLLKRLPKTEAAQISCRLPLAVCETAERLQGEPSLFVKAVRQYSMIIAGQEVQTIH